MVGLLQYSIAYQNGEKYQQGTNFQRNNSIHIQHIICKGQRKKKKKAECMKRASGLDRTKRFVEGREGEREKI